MMRAPLVALLVLAVVSELEAEPEEAEGQCIWYDTCGWDQDYGEDGGNQVHFLNCHYEGPPKPASQEMLDILKDTCPHMYQGGEVGEYSTTDTFLS